MAFREDGMSKRILSVDDSMSIRQMVQFTSRRRGTRSSLPRTAGTRSRSSGPEGGHGVHGT
jgi:hypothetical protein